MMSWPAVPRMVATMASPHASRSARGSYIPCAAGRLLNGTVLAAAPNGAVLEGAAPEGTVPAGAPDGTVLNGAAPEGTVPAGAPDGAPRSCTDGSVMLALPGRKKNGTSSALTRIRWRRSPRR